MNTEQLTPLFVWAVRRVLQWVVGVLGLVTVSGQVDALAGSFGAFAAFAAAEYLSRRAAQRQQAVGAAKADGVIQLTGIAQQALNSQSEKNNGN